MQGWRNSRCLHIIAVIFFCSILTLLISFFFKPYWGGPGALDFNVYYYAGKYVLEGKDIYGQLITGEHLHPMPFTYTPFAAVLCSILALIPLPIAFFLISFLSILCLFFSIKTVLRGGWTGTHLSLVVAVVVMALMPVSQNLLNGQINMLLVAACLADCVRSPSSRWARYRPPGVLIGLAAAIKLTPAFFVLYMLVTRQWRMATWSIMTGAVSVLVGALVLPSQTLNFFTTVLWNSQERVAAGQPVSIAFNNSLGGLLAFLGSHSSILYGVLAVGIAVSIFWVASLLFRRGEGLAAALVVGIGSCLIAPVSWLHHWVWLVPAMVYCLIYRRGIAPALVVVAYTVIVLSFDVYRYRSVGEEMISGGNPALALVGFVLRYSVLFSGVALVAILLWSRRRSWEEQWFLPTSMRRQFSVPESASPASNSCGGRH